MYTNAKQSQGRTDDKSSKLPKRILDFGDSPEVRDTLVEALDVKPHRVVLGGRPRGA